MLNLLLNLLLGEWEIFMLSDLNPVAHKNSSVVVGKARFQMLTDRLIRLEWAEDGVFEDRATLTVVNRRLPPLAFTLKEHANGELTIDTGALKLTYRPSERPFEQDDLTVSFPCVGKKMQWYPGKVCKSNLKGATRSLDNCDGDRCKQGTVELCDGYISRDGWAVVDDSASLVLSETGSGMPWIVSRAVGQRRDLYLLAYGHDYTTALRDAARVFGRQPLPPRFTLGYWWSRYGAYTDRDLEQLGDCFDELGIPLDVLVIDMDWQKEGWTGYTWDRTRFPDPREFLRWCKTKDLKVTLNLHPANGVGRHAQAFKAMCRELDLNPDTTEHIPFDCTNRRFMEAYFKILHHPQEEAGVDFWWLDWQQGKVSKMPGLDPLPWLNHLHWYNMAQRANRKRPLIFSRFGGTGRYPIGFSGYTSISWNSLAYQPYFTASGANVLYGYWSHDIGGHMDPQGRPSDPELYLRWLQFGVYSPILRTHTSKLPQEERRPFTFPSPHNFLMRDLIRLRHTLAPYIYTENRRCFDTAISLVRPMYYDWPEVTSAYKAREQYMFGDQMLVAPVIQPGDDHGQAVCEVWLPEASWIDTATGERLEGAKKFKRRYLLNEIPVFVRPGAVIPCQPCKPRLEPGPYRALDISIHPGPGGNYLLYEDDGVSQDYLQGQFAMVPINHQYKGKKRTIVIGPSRGDYQGFEKKRAVRLRLHGCLPPARILAMGADLTWSLRPSALRWSYDGNGADVLINLPDLDITRKNEIVVTWELEDNTTQVEGLKGLFRRLEQVRELQPNLRPLTHAIQTGNRIERHPAATLEELQILRETFPEIAKQLKKQAKKDEKALELLKRARKQFALLLQTKGVLSDQ